MFLALREEGGGVDCMVTTGGFTCTSGVTLSSVDVKKCNPIIYSFALYTVKNLDFFAGKILSRNGIYPVTGGEGLIP